MFWYGNDVESIPLNDGHDDDDDDGYFKGEKFLCSKKLQVFDTNETRLVCQSVEAMTLYVMIETNLIDLQLIAELGRCLTDFFRFLLKI